MPPPQVPLQALLVLTGAVPHRVVDGLNLQPSQHGPLVHCGVVAEQLPQLPAEQTWVPAPQVVEQAWVMPSVLPSQLSSLPLQVSMAPGLRVASLSLQSPLPLGQALLPVQALEASQ